MAERHGSPGRLNVHSEARSISRAKASASLSRSIISAESLLILCSSRLALDPIPALEVQSAHTKNAEFHKHNLVFV